MRNHESAVLEAAGTAERSGDYAAAFDAWQHLATMTGRPDYFCKAGRIAQKLGRWTDSEAAFLDALRVDKAFSLAIVALGSLFLTRTDGDPSTNARKAKAWLEQGVGATPGPIPLSLLGDAHNRLGDKKAAQEAFRKAIEIDETYAEAYLNLGLLLADAGETGEAEGLLRTATLLKPNSHKAHGGLGVLLQKLGKYSEAEDEFRRAVKIDPTDAIANSHLNRLPGPDKP